MSSKQDQIHEVDTTWNIESEVLNEAGKEYLLLPRFYELSDGRKIDALLCYQGHGGYKSRLLFEEKIPTKKERNWNANPAMLVGRNWFGFSYRIPCGLPFKDQIHQHLGGVYGVN